ncbi:MAG TPA: hypothetical protein VFJ57_14135 [Solirubrobacterales bacterium]|nr:hypothetical protein [Solirubrobacterales bacterium]
MNQRQRRTRLSIAAFLVALTVTAVGAAVAAAEWEWQLEELQLSGLGSSETISGSGGTFKLATTIAGAKVTISCEKAELSSSTITPEGKGASTLKLSTGCKASGPPGCKVTEPISLNSSTEVITSGTQIFNRYSPVESKFATVKIESCAIAGEFPVAGTFAGEIEPGERVSQPLTFSPAIAEQAGTSLTFAGKAATLEGKYEMAASGPSAGQDVAPSPLKADPVVFLDFKGTKVGNSDTLPVTLTVISKENVKFATVQIVGSAGILTKSADTCSGNEFKKDATCTVTIKFAPTAAVKYTATVLYPWETASGKAHGGRATLVTAFGT